MTLFDKDIVQAVLDGDNEKATEICKQQFEALGMAHKFPQHRVGTKGLCVEWVEEGVEFWVSEYDGYESLCFRGELEWWTA